MKINFFSKYFVIALFCIFFSLSSQAAYSQDFSSIDNDLQTLEDLINDTLTNTQEQQKLLDDLKQNLEKSGNLIASYALNKCTAQPCRLIMPHSVAPINAAVYNKSKAAFRRPTVRNTITEQEKLLADLREQLNAMYETYKKQSVLSARYAQSSKFWKTFTIIAIPVTAVISGGLVWVLVK
jgi:hypothetical protein